jgi:uncharacterized protein YeaO (DUF488 family)
MKTCILCIVSAIAMVGLLLWNDENVTPSQNIWNCTQNTERDWFLFMSEYRREQQWRGEGDVLAAVQRIYHTYILESNPH